MMMEMFIYWMVGYSMKAGWSTAGMEYGALCAMTPGDLKKQLLCVVNWDFQLNVQGYSTHTYFRYINVIITMQMQ